MPIALNHVLTEFVSECGSHKLKQNYIFGKKATTQKQKRDHSNLLMTMVSLILKQFRTFSNMLNIYALVSFSLVRPVRPRIFMDFPGKLLEIPRTKLGKKQEKH